MILINQYLIIFYLIVVIVYLYTIFIKKQTKKYTIFFFIYLIIVLILSLYYYRPLTLGDILDNNKYNILFENSTEIVAEEIKKPSLETIDVIYHLKNMNIRNTSKNYKKIESEFLNEKNSYVIKQGEKNIFRITILGDYEYIEYGGKYYKYVE